MVIFVVLITIACLHSFGRDNLGLAEKAEMTFWRVVAQSVAMLATGTSKAPVGLFLLRLVAKPWHKVSLWTVIIIMAILSLVSTILTWASCTPVALMWDDRIKNATCIDSTPVTAALAVSTILADMVYVGLAWIFIWKLPNPRREKVLLAFSFGLGIL
ncbi:uncharacterized protein B0I36DRAFT_29210 [Microdochium trichocladiopsis]|uniref:Rhodopsin domain-containing protein n=1 Tax=Microdochium trichocladiopsis TaxID=1682393 RepID=A0A9P9BKZ0_9PEZI|nr:uncharacterized protein B0I36DRAFT_29210 [Microdochium trichocladiopsis]KAH7021117.1 hypothetical protein B0I36DRAFT_29210 [Microdochium trichocladiopsis]